MRRALELARLGLGLTLPNPRVGAVLVRGGKIIGEGPSPARGRTARRSPRRRRGEEAGPHRGGRNPLRDPGALLHPRPHAALHRADRAGKNRPGRFRRDRSESGPRGGGPAAPPLRRRGGFPPGFSPRKRPRSTAISTGWIARRRPWVTAKIALSLDGAHHRAGRRRALAHLSGGAARGA